MHKPAGAAGTGKALIKSGDHLRSLGAKWATMTEQQRAPYKRMASAKVFSSDDEVEGNTDEGGQSMSQGVGPWGLGSATSPMSSDELCTPTFPRELDQEVQRWLKELMDKLPHVNGTLPYKKTCYDDPCGAAACRSAEWYAGALSLQHQYNAQFKKQPEVTFSLLLLGQ